MRNCYLSRNYKGVDGAGNKAKTDIEQIMESNGFINVGLTSDALHKLHTRFSGHISRCVETSFSLRKGDRLVVTIST
mgnify:CR=1 FL=1